MPKKTPDLRDNITRLEGGLTDRQKDFARRTALEVVARLLQEEGVNDGCIATYGELYDLTQSERFMAWQEEVLVRPKDGAHPADPVLSVLVQLERSQLTIQAIYGYLKRVQRQLEVASENVKYVGNSIFQAYGGELSSVTAKDREGIIWQMYTAASAPDGVVLRRQRADAKKGRGKRGSTQSGPKAPRFDTDKTT